MELQSHQQMFGGTKKEQKKLRGVGAAQKKKRGDDARRGGWGCPSSQEGWMERSPLTRSGWRDAACHCCHLEAGQPELEKYPLAPRSTPRNGGLLPAPMTYSKFQQSSYFDYLL